MKPSTVNEIEYFQFGNSDNDQEPVFVTSGCVYGIDSEGTLYYAPRYIDGEFNTEEFCEVEEISEEEEEEIKPIWNSLIQEYKKLGWYYC